MDSDTTHTTGLDESVAKLRPFHIINSVLRCRSRGRNSASDWRRPAVFGGGIVDGTLGGDILGRLAVW